MNDALSLLKEHWGWFIIVLWFFCYGIKCETAGLKFYINGMFHTYTMNEELEITVVIEEAKNE